MLLNLMGVFTFLISFFGFFLALKSLIRDYYDKILISELKREKYEKRIEKAIYQISEKVNTIEKNQEQIKKWNNGLEICKYNCSAKFLHGNHSVSG